jgi:hypothetical protein
MAKRIDELEWPAEMSEEERDEMRDILCAYDRAVTDFDADHTVIYPSEADRLRLFHASQKRWSRSWSRAALCMYEGCTEQSVTRSHSISVSASVNLIAEDGHVATPRLKETGVEMERIGVHDASTFPGFCQRHEARRS